MAGIPLPALGIHPPDPNSTMSQIGQFIRLRDLANAEAARNSIAQQQFDAEAPLRQAQAQLDQQRASALQAAQAQQAATNKAYSQAYANGTPTQDALAQALAQSGQGGEIPEAVKPLQAMDADKRAQAIESIKQWASVAPQLASIQDPKAQQAQGVWFANKIGDAEAAKLWQENPTEAAQHISVLAAQAANRQPSNEAELALAAQQTGPDGKPTPDATKAQQALASLKTQGPPTTKTIVGKDGQPHVMGWNPKTSTFDVDFGKAPENYAGFLQGFSNPNNPSTQGAAQLIASYQMMPPSGYALSRPEGQALMAAVKQVNPDYNANGYTLAHQLISGPDGRNIGNLNTSIKHMNALDQVAGALGNKDLQARNSVVNWASQQLGQAPPVSFDALKSAVASEIASALKGNATDQEIKNAQGFINRANSPSQMHDALKNTMEIMAQKLGTYQERLDGATTGRAGMVPVLLPQSKAVLQAWGVSASGTGLKGSIGGPNKGDTRQYLNQNYTFDGSEWVKQ